MLTSVHVLNIHVIMSIIIMIKFSAIFFVCVLWCVSKVGRGVEAPILNVLKRTKVKSIGGNIQLIIGM